MFTYNERDMHRMPAPYRTHFPVKQEILSSGILDEENDADNEADIALLRLPAPSLRGTFAKAYHLLTLLVSQIGWDELLRCRSSVFVMEEEYRMQKAQEEDRVKSAPRTPVNADLSAPNGHGVANSSSQSIPEIKIWSEADQDKEDSEPGNGTTNGNADGSDFNGKPLNELEESAKPAENEEVSIWRLVLPQI